MPPISQIPQVTIPPTPPSPGRPAPASSFVDVDLNDRTDDPIPCRNTQGDSVWLETSRLALNLPPVGDLSACVSELVGQHYSSPLALGWSLINFLAHTEEQKLDLAICAFLCSQIPECPAMPVISKLLWPELSHICSYPDLVHYQNLQRLYELDADFLQTIQELEGDSMVYQLYQLGYSNWAVPGTYFDRFFQNVPFEDSVAWILLVFAAGGTHKKMILRRLVSACQPVNPLLAQITTVLLGVCEPVDPKVSLSLGDLQGSELSLEGLEINVLLENLVRSKFGLHRVDPQIQPLKLGYVQLLINQNQPAAADAHLRELEALILSFPGYQMVPTFLEDMHHKGMYLRGTQYAFRPAPASPTHEAVSGGRPVETYQPTRMTANTSVISPADRGSQITVPQADRGAPTPIAHLATTTKSTLSWFKNSVASLIDASPKDEMGDIALDNAFYYDEVAKKWRERGKEDQEDPDIQYDYMTGELIKPQVDVLPPPSLGEIQSTFQEGASAGYNPMKQNFYAL